MVDQTAVDQIVVDQPLDLSSFDQVANIEQRHLAEQLSKLARDAIRGDAIQGHDAVKLLWLAEQAMLAGLWQTAAQLFVWTMVCSFTNRYAANADARILVKQANGVILLACGHSPHIKSRADLLLYGPRRLVAALSADGIGPSGAGDWTVSAFSRLARQDAVYKQSLDDAVSVLLPESPDIGSHFRSEIGPTRKTLTSSLSVAADNASDRVPSSNTRRGRIYCLIAAVALILVAAYLFRGRFSFPQVSFLLDGSSWLGCWLSTILVALPFLLIATWIFAFLESRRARTFYYISPWHLVVDRKIVPGELTPFVGDWFFHIFQFVWIGLLIIAWFLFQDYQAMGDWLRPIWNPNAHIQLQTFMNWVDGTRPYSDAAALVIAIIACIGAIHHQWAVQNQRQAGADAYWWDGRIGTAEWRVRLAMVGLDVFVAAFVVVKMLAIWGVAYDLVMTNDLAITYFSPDGVGGLRPFTDMLMHLSWAVFLFGMFVVASLLLHWNLREYRIIDLSQVIAYVVFLFIAAVPLVSLESRLTGDKEASIRQLADTGPKSGANLADTATYVKNVSTVRDWPVSALNIGLLGNPVLPLGFQFVVVVAQFLVRTGKLPKLPIPGFGGPEAGADEKENRKNSNAAA